MSLPYKVGKLYRPINGYWYQPSVYSDFLGIIEDPYYGGLYYGQPMLDNKRIMFEWSDDKKAILPIAFVESSQSVVCEIPAEIRTPTTVCDTSNGVSIRNAEHTAFKLIRFEIKVEEFIRNFELVL